MSKQARSYRGLIDFQREERACNSAYACRDSEMLVVFVVVGRCT